MRKRAPRIPVPARLARSIGVLLLLLGSASAAASARSAPQTTSATPPPSAVFAGLGCPGDCNADGTVTLDELVLAVGAALGSAPVEQCPAFRLSEGDAIPIDGLVQAVDRALHGCDSAPPFLAVLSAFPAELAAVLEHATIDEEIAMDDRVFRVGQIGGVRVVAGMTGIGLVNATEITAAVLDRFAVNGVVVSGVAGSTLRIGDVTVPAAWMLEDEIYAAYQAWIDLAEATTAPGTVPLQNCILVPDRSDEPICLPHQPAIVVGGIGHSSDPFGGNPLACRPGGDDVFGCDVASAGALVSAGFGARIGSEVVLPLTDPPVPVAQDMETAAIASQAALYGLPFIAFRAVSDGAGDPLMLPSNNFEQFGVYYPLAAHNAAAAATAFLEQLARSRDAHAAAPLHR